MGFCALIGGGLSELEWIASDLGALSVDIPADLDSDDADNGQYLAILGGMAHGGTVVVDTPADWESIDIVADPGLATLTSRVCYKVLTSADIGATITSATSGNVRRHLLLIFHADDTIENVSFTTPNSFAAASDPPDQSVLASGEDTPGIVIGVNGSTDSAGDDATSSPAFDGTADTTNYRIGYKIYNSSPADHTISATGTGARSLQSFYLSVS